MYNDFFDFQKEPFSIAPDPRFLFMSEQHKEALAHLVYGIQSSGAFVVLSGEIGSGKTTVCRCFLEQVSDEVDIAFILNPKLSAQELLASICDELGIAYQDQSIKHLTDVINQFLLASYADARSTVVIIEEAQNLSEDVLEQLRLLTNLETNEKKLLQIILLAQPEFLDVLEKKGMKQLSQRITARFHLSPLNKQETFQYLSHRLTIAGAKIDPFTPAVKKAIYKHSRGTPRLINLIADRCLLGAYANSQKVVDKQVLKQSIKELQLPSLYSRTKRYLRLNLSVKAALTMLIVLCFLVLLYLLVFVKALGFDLPFIASSSPLPGVETQNFNHSVWQGADDQSLSIFYSDTADNFTNYFEKESLTAATKSLSGVWNLKSGISEPPSASYIAGKNEFCDLAKSVQLSCYISKANMGLLLKLGRPVILKFLDATGNNFYGVLLGLEDDNLVIQFSSQQRKLSFTELERIWLGDFMMWVNTPTEWQSRVLSYGEKSEFAFWINKQFVLLDGKLIKEVGASEFYSRETIERVKLLQSQAGILADGKVGLKTIIYLNSLLDMSAPKLLGSKGLAENIFNNKKMQTNTLIDRREIEQ